MQWEWFVGGLKENALGVHKADGEVMLSGSVPVLLKMSSGHPLHIGQCLSSCQLGHSSHDGFSKVRAELLEAPLKVQALPELLIYEQYKQFPTQCQ